MIPGMNNKQMQRMMKQMGIKQEEIPADQVIIKVGDKEMVFSEPSVQKVDMMGQETFQLSGGFEIRESDSRPDISDEDVQTVVDQTGVSEDEAREAIDAAEGDLAQAIMDLQS